MSLDGVSPQLLGAKSKAGQIVDAALDSLSGLGATRNLCCDYPAQPCCWDDRGGRPKARSMLRGARGFGLLGPIDTMKAKPWLLVAGLVLGGMLASRARR